jgi:DNA-binding response OmpR family regulator
MHADKQGGFNIGLAVVDPSKATVSLGEAVNDLQAVELRLLEFLFDHRDRCFTREELLRSVWGYQGNGLVTRTVDQTVARVRQKIEDRGPAHKHLKTVRGSGYCLRLD